MKGGEARRLAASIEKTGRGERKAASPKQLKADLAQFAIEHYGGNIDKAWKYVQSECPSVKKTNGAFVNTLVEGAKQKAYDAGQEASRRAYKEYAESSGRRSAPREDPPQTTSSRQESSRHKTIEERARDAADAQRIKDFTVREQAKRAAGGRRSALIAPIAAVSLTSAMHGSAPPLHEQGQPAREAAAASRVLEEPRACASAFELHAAAEDGPADLQPNEAIRWQPAVIVLAAPGS